ncbi:hypothetical protein EV426DRAFT_575988 [Tirmania nivea]|nr:hypothetical protein EV426DRAFT_575988 [Tirmania nivea]
MTSSTNTNTSVANNTPIVHDWRPTSIVAVFLSAQLDMLVNLLLAPGTLIILDLLYAYVMAFIIVQLFKRLEQMQVLPNWDTATTESSEFVSETHFPDRGEGEATMADSVESVANAETIAYEGQGTKAATAPHSTTATDKSESANESPQSDKEKKEEKDKVSTADPVGFVAAASQSI